MSVKKIALAAVSICLAAGSRKTATEPAVAPKIYETKPGEKVSISAELAKAHPDAFRDPTADEAKGDFKDLTKTAAAGKGSQAATAAGNGTGSNEGADQVTGGKNGDPEGNTGKPKAEADKDKSAATGKKAGSDSDLTG